MRKADLVAIAATIFLGAFLVFQVQPMIARFVLPWFGGSPAVWTSAMLFFQVMLLVGYAYTHLIVARLDLRRQCLLHVALLLASLALLPVTPDAAARPVGGDPALPQLLAILTVSVGLPYVLVSSTSPLLQAWFARADAARSPYWLFALSNLGSLLGLLAYPFLIERVFGLVDQTRLWSAGYVLFVIASTAVTFLVLRGAGDGQTELAGPSLTRSAQTAPRTRLSWLLLSASGVVMLLAATNQLCKDVAVVPLLWVLPLALYLISFIVSFGRPAWYQRAVWGPLLFGALAGITYLLRQEFAEDEVDLLVQIGTYCAGVLVYCVVCHGELYRLRPETDRLTEFYLFVSLGGALGGIATAVVAPLVLTGYWEFHLVLLLVPVLLVVLARADARALPPSPARTGFAAVSVAGIAVAAVLLAGHVHKHGEAAIHVERSFYGVLRIYENETRQGRVYHTLFHGRIEHGAQYLEEPMRSRPIAYYGPDSGVGRTLAAARALQRRTADTHALNVGVIGLGVGTIAAYGRPEDRFRFYEIDAAVEHIARDRFRYLGDSRAEIDVVLGDARISLEAEAPKGFDALFVDAFNGDGIPVHLLTTEALELYRRHLAPGGMVAFHVSNLHFDLRPVALALAEQSGMALNWIDDSGGKLGENGSDWLILHDQPITAEALRLYDDPLPEDMVGVLWTDDHADVLATLWD
jgi:hypothetical protein